MQNFTGLRLLVNSSVYDGSEYHHLTSIAYIDFDGWIEKRAVYLTSPLLPAQPSESSSYRFHRMKPNLFILYASKNTMLVYFCQDWPERDLLPWLISICVKKSIKETLKNALEVIFLSQVSLYTDLFHFFLFRTFSFRLWTANMHSILGKGTHTEKIPFCI